MKDKSTIKKEHSAAARKPGRPTTDPKRHETRIRMSDTDIELLEYCCEQTEMTKTDVIRDGIKRFTQLLNGKSDDKKAPKIIKTYFQPIPELRLIGIRYADSTKGKNQTIAQKWQNWSESGSSKILEALNPIKEMSGEGIGLSIQNGDVSEYMIGMFFQPQTEVPQGFEHIDLPRGNLGVCWVHGSYGNRLLTKGMTMSEKKLKSIGCTPDNNRTAFQRRDFQRFSQGEDESDGVILDCCFYITPGMKKAKTNNTEQKNKKAK